MDNVAESTATAQPATAPVEATGASAPPTDQTPTPAVETQPPSPPAADPAKEREQARFAALSRREKAIVEKQQRAAAELKAKEEALQKREAEIAERATRAERLERLRAAAKDDPESFLRDVYGDDYYDQITELKLNGGKPDPARIARSVEERLTKRLEEQEKKREEERQKAVEAQRAQAQAAVQQQIDAFRSQVKDFVTKSADYEITNLLDASDYVPQLIEAHYAQTQRVMEPKEAADLVESELVARVMKSKKLREALAKELAPKPPEPAPVTEPPKTLTNALPAAPATPQPQHARREDAVARAVRAMQEVEARKAAQRSA